MKCAGHHHKAPSHDFISEYVDVDLETSSSDRRILPLSSLWPALLNAVNRTSVTIAVWALEKMELDLAICHRNPRRHVFSEVHNQKRRRPLTVEPRSVSTSHGSLVKTLPVPFSVACRNSQEGLVVDIQHVLKWSTTIPNTSEFAAAIKALQRV